MLKRNSCLTSAFVTVVMGAVLWTGNPAIAGSYSLTDLFPVQENTNAGALDLNNAGQVVGFSGAYAFLYSNGALTNLGTLAGSGSVATSINDAGQVVGSFRPQFPGGSTRAFEYSNGTISNLGTLGGRDSFASGINTGGQVVGAADTTGNAARHAFLYDNGTMMSLGTLGGKNSFAFGINNGGQIVGAAEITTGNTAQHAFLYDNGTMTSLGTLGGTNSSAEGINISGQVVGWSDTTTTGNFAQQAFLYDNGAMTNLGTLGGHFSQALGINDAGHVVGASTPADTTILNATVWIEGTLLNLNSQLDATGTGVTLNSAYAINNNGQIAANGTNALGQPALFLLTPNPVPEPETFLLLLPGLLGLFLWRSHTRSKNLS